MDLQLVASYFTVKSTDIFCSAEYISIFPAYYIPYFKLCRHKDTTTWLRGRTAVWRLLGFSNGHFPQKFGLNVNTTMPWGITLNSNAYFVSVPPTKFDMYFDHLKTINRKRIAILHTGIILSIGANRSEQTVQIQIWLLLKGAVRSGSTLFALIFAFLDTLLRCKKQNFPYLGHLRQLF